jgi:glycosyltransferase involved in cell wall biosynthesis
VGFAGTGKGKTKADAAPTFQTEAAHLRRVAVKPLVSILIPAYNAEATIAETLQSAIAQTWARKEIIVVDDGSQDGTLAEARKFESKGVSIVSVENQGAAAARNHAYSLCQGEYIQWLDADDLLAPDKIEKQLAALPQGENSRILLSAPWAPFYYRMRESRPVRTSLCQNQSPVEWLLRKMGESLHMQTATWLTSREIAEGAGPWDTRLLSDDDGEYFCRVLLASKQIVFVPDTHIYYRISPSSRLSFIGRSDRKKDALLVSMKLHIKYIRTLEDSERVRRACLKYLQHWYIMFYPERPDLMEKVQSMANELGGQMEIPQLRWKFAWMAPVFGFGFAKDAQNTLPQFKASCIRQFDRFMYKLESN